ncbi:MAG: aminotransferase class I/II-fold pyridoxal phosphate-dependent enzyme [Clostridia bacterium]|nr:aminotransferase class I/II-fold pyridoxal phosphate-dependent enzyme [Clostridia bacterium]
MSYANMNKDELSRIYNDCKAKYDEILKENLTLDMSRGKPSKEQEKLSLDMLDVINSKTDFEKISSDDIFNYGVPFGLDSAKQLMAEIMDVKKEQIIVGGNSSLTLMFDLVSQLMFEDRGEGAWKDESEVKFICPVPGYDRHFGILEHFGIKMINVSMTADGPSIEEIEELVKDPTVKGMICVPKYANPTGITFSDEVVKKLAKMETKAKDFVIIWDNAYVVHDLLDKSDKLLNILDECEKAGNADRVFMFSSTSKITFAGAGISAVASSENNLNFIKAKMKKQTIGNDKINQLRHVLYLKDINGVKEHMQKQAQLITPKFDMVLDLLNENLKDKEIANWTNPNGGYFISLNVTVGSAKRVFELCKQAGVKLTNCGDTFPYGKDPKDENIRIAPTYPTVEELKKATQLLILCIEIAAAEELLNK